MFNGMAASAHKTTYGSIDSALGGVPSSLILAEECSWVDWVTGCASDEYWLEFCSERFCGDLSDA